MNLFSVIIIIFKKYSSPKLMSMSGKRLTILFFSHFVYVDVPDVLFSIMHKCYGLHMNVFLVGRINTPDSASHIHFKLTL